MRAKEFLKQYKRAKAEADRLERQLAELDDLVGNITVDPTAEHVQTSRNPDQIGSLVARRTDMQESLKKAKDHALDVMQEVITVIDKLEDPDYQIILQARYIERKSWRYIAELVHYDGRYVFKLHNRALKKVDAIINKTQKDTGEV